LDADQGVHLIDASMDVLLIHGALGNGEQLKPLAKRLEGRATRIGLTGHGKSPIPAEGLSYERFLSDIDAAAKGEKVHLFGYSMGGYAAALYAAKHPERVASVATLGSKLLWDEAGLNALLQRLDADAIAQHVPKYAERLAHDHGDPRWRELVKATAELVTKDFHTPMLTPEVCAQVKCPVLVCSGDRDDMALAPDTLKAARRFPDAGALILPRTKHPFDLVDLDLLVPHLVKFWEGIPA
jgi:pimeloyl-ACP methyl ester carboxylesterase